MIVNCGVSLFVKLSVESTPESDVPFKSAEEMELGFVKSIVKLNPFAIEVVSETFPAESIATALRVYDPSGILVSGVKLSVPPWPIATTESTAVVMPV